MQKRNGVRAVSSEMILPIGSVRVVRSHWLEDVDFSGAAGHHHVQLSVMPQVRGGLAGFPHRWGPHRMVRLGEMFFLPADEEIRVRALPHVQHSICCDFVPDAAARFFDSDLSWTDRRLEACLNLASPRIHNLLFGIGQELSAPRLRTETIVELMLGQLLIELGRHLIAVDQRDTHGGLAPWRIRLIDERLKHDDTPPTLEELADLCQLSVRHMTRAFRRRHGQSIGHYMAEHRIERAKLLLLSGLSINSVAQQMKFATASNFTAAFRRLTGETPRDFVRRKPGATQPIVDG